MAFWQSAEENAEEIVKQLVRLNDNFERYLSHLHVPDKRLSDLPPERIVVSEPTSELEQALKEHAELMGHENDAKDR